MLPTSARVSQEVFEPLIGIQYPMLCSRKKNGWQIGTASIRANNKAATGLRFVNWCHASINEEDVNSPPSNQTVVAYCHIEDQLLKASAGSDEILVLTTTCSSATTLQNHFHEFGKQANAETAVKVAGATARHCIVETEPAHGPPSLTVTDDTMATSESTEVVAVSSANPKSDDEATVPSSLGAADHDSPMERECGKLAGRHRGWHTALHLGSIPEHGQEVEPQFTMEELACQSGPAKEVRSDPATPSECSLGHRVKTRKRVRPFCESRS